MKSPVIAGLILALIGSWANAQGAPGTTHEFRAAVMAAIQDNDDMEIRAPELQWQLSRIEARKSAAAVIRAAENDTELKIAGAVWDLYNERVTCRIEAAATSNLDRCHASLGQLRSLALDQSGLAPARLYPHAQK
jgi:hypothetical protein